MTFEEHIAAQSAERATMDHMHAVQDQKYHQDWWLFNGGWVLVHLEQAREIWKRSVKKYGRPLIVHA